MLLLAFDTATPAVTVAVHDGTRLLAASTSEGATAHGERLAPAIREALTEAGADPADLTDIAVGVGPGPFTGLRVGVVTALTLASTLGIGAHGICTLDTLAAEAVAAGGPGEEFLVATDARRREVYWARYDAAGARLDGPDVAVPADLAARFPGRPVIGRGADLYADLLGPSRGPRDPSAAALASAVAGGSAALLPVEPLYLRRPDAVPLDQR
ncbi:MAG: tRNA (adenosine(37)-N6)-threonylcarbamoyltransferase complex dimerization subunit type 1 TsaB [Aeromicrobium sp.]|uniref:tRNA (adenosine(37)-N6)-threonylcarbamoyltransferase complex dimerization subunit type 1 TsaB n=1 Tax=Aeromicrobium sp. TaxID=1871063 RepID=UPI0039E307A6